MPTTYFGPETTAAIQNFPITDYQVDRRWIYAVATVKKATAKANAEVGRIPKEIAAAISAAADEVLAGKLDSEFITNAIQGGAGTSLHMNVNEVLAARATEICGEKVHPNDHVNAGQSTNDVVPTALKIVVHQLLTKAIHSAQILQKAFAAKSAEFDDVLKVGRTHLQDAVPIRLGQSFGAYAAVAGRAAERLAYVQNKLLMVNLGGTAVGTGLTASRHYIKSALENLRQLTGLPLQSADCLIDATQNADIFVAVSSTLKTSIVAISKIASDLRILASGPRSGLGEIRLPEMQKGSSIMPGKVNPVLPETINQIAFQICGQDLTVTLAAEHGQLELNVFFPVLGRNLLEAVTIFARGVQVFAEKCVAGIECDRDRCRELFENSVAAATALSPILGYEKAAAAAKKAVKEKSRLADVVVGEELLLAADYAAATAAEKLTRLAD